MKRNRYTLTGNYGYYYLVDHKRNRETCTGYDCGDWPWNPDGTPHDMLKKIYRRALSIKY